MQESHKKTLIVSRFSAFGDVVIAVNVLRAVTKQNPDYKIVFLTKKPFAFLFETIESVEVFCPDLKGKHAGMKGLYRLSRDLQAFSPVAYLDIHNVLRTKLLRFYFAVQGIACRKIHKGRLAKYRLTRKRRKVFKPLKNSAERYADVFRAYGLKADLSDIPKSPIPIPTKETLQHLPEKSGKWIGIAPFSLHRQKIYPPEKMREIIKILTQKDFRLFIFGGGKSDQAEAETMISEIEKAESLIERFGMKEELGLIARMDLMLTMDSGNMHLASLSNTPLLVIWGGTHPYAGFAPYKNPNYRAIQIPHSELPCRPCSVYGKKPCHRGDWACMNRLSPDTVSQMIIDTV